MEVGLINVSVSKCYDIFIELNRTDWLLGQDSSVLEHEYFSPIKNDWPDSGSWFESIQLIRYYLNQWNSIWFGDIFIVVNQWICFTDLDSLIDSSEKLTGNQGYFTELVEFQLNPFIDWLLELVKFQWFTFREHMLFSGSVPY